MTYRIFAASLFAAALILLGRVGLTAADDKKDGTHHGHVVKVADGKLTMVGDDKKEHTHPVAKDAKVTIDGKDAKLEDLKPHTHVAVTLKEDGGKHTIAKIEAETKK